MRSPPDKEDQNSSYSIRLMLVDIKSGEKPPAWVWIVALAMILGPSIGYLIEKLL